MSLIKSVRKNNIERVREILKPREICYRTKHGQIFKKVIYRNINCGDDRGYTALMTAVDEKNTEIVKLLILAGAKLDIQDKEGFTALLRACYDNNIEIAKLLIEAGADINIENNNGRNAFWLWILANDDILIPSYERNLRSERVFFLLITSGMNLYKQNEYGNTILIWTCLRKNYKISKLILEHIDADNSNDLRSSTSEARSRLSEFVNLQNIAGYTALMIAASKRDHETVRLLIDAGAKLDIENNNGYSALRYCKESRNGFLEIIYILYKYNLRKDFNDIDLDYSVVLHAICLCLLFEYTDELFIFYKKCIIYIIDTIGIALGSYIPLDVGFLLVEFGCDTSLCKIRN